MSFAGTKNPVNVGTKRVRPETTKASICDKVVLGFALVRFKSKLENYGWLSQTVSRHGIGAKEKGTNRQRVISVTIHNEHCVAKRGHSQYLREHFREPPKGPVTGKRGKQGKFAGERHANYTTSIPCL